MIFFNERKLGKLLYNVEVTERQQLYYLTVLLLIEALSGTAMWHHQTHVADLNLYTYLSDALSVLGVVAVTFYAFGINDKGDGRAFIVRYTCLSLPISLKTLVIGPTVSFLMFMLDNLTLYYPLAKAGHSEKEMEAISKLAIIGPCQCLGVLLVTLFVAWRFKISFQIASGQSDGSEGLSIPILGSDEGGIAI